MEIFRNGGVLTRGLAYFLSFVAAATPFHAIAASEAIGKAAAQGQNFAEMLRRDMQYPTGGNGSITFPDMGESVQIKDLYPGTSGKTGLDSGFFSPGGDDVGTAEQYFDNGVELDRKGMDKQTQLYDDAVGGGKIRLGYTADLDSSPSIQGAAYKIILDKKNMAKPDLRKDPLVNASRDIFTDLEGFSDCKLEQVVSKQQGNIHVPDMQVCERLHKPKGDCEIEHVIKVEPIPSDVVFLVDNSGSMDAVIRDILMSVRQFAMLLGGKENEVRLGGIITRSQYASNQIRMTDDVDAFHRWVNGIRISSGATYITNVGNYVLDNFSFRPDKQKVMIIIGNEDSPGAGYQALAQRLQAEGFKTFIFHDNAQVRTLGLHVGNKFTVDGLFRVAQMLTVVEDDWVPKECLNDAIATLEEFCEGSYKVTEAANPCATISGFRVCPGDPIEQMLRPPPIPNVGKLDKFVKVSPLKCDYNIGSMGCYTDATGVLQCPENNGEKLETCSKFEEDEQCGFIKSTCIDGAQGSWGTCYGYEEVWDCGSDVKFEGDVSDQEFVCDGDVSCMGESCVKVDRETSDSFGKAAGLLNVLEHADGMMECADAPGNSDPLKHCTIFKGEEGTCKRAFGGTVDCCDKPKGVSLGDYLTMLQAMKKIDSALVAVKQAGGTGASVLNKFRFPDDGVYKALKQPVVDGFKKITSPFVNYAESSTATTTLSQFAVEKTLQVVEKVLGEAAKEFMGAMLKEMGYEGIVQGGMAGAAGGNAGQAAANQAGQEVAGQAAQTTAQSMGAAVGSVISVIGWIYLAYQVAMLIIQMIYKCEKEELQLMVEVQLRKCSYLGSYCDKKILGSCTVKKQAYCCYESPLARIVVEQGVKQLGRTQGEAKAPQCDGLTLEELERLDWDKIDLSEWTGMLIQHNLYAGVKNLDADALTGSGSFLPGEEGGKRPDVVDRTQTRFEEAKVDDIRTDLSQKMEFSGGKH